MARAIMKLREGRKIGMGLKRHIGPLTANTTIEDAVEFVGVDTNGGAVTVTLGTELVEEGRTVIVKDVGGLAGTNNISVVTEGSAAIDGSSTGGSIASNYGAIVLECDGTNWFGSAAVSGGVL